MPDGSCSSLMSSRIMPIDRAEQEFGQHLGHLGLAGTGGPREQEHAHRAVRIGETGLQHRHPVDQAVDRIGLPEHPGGEARAQRGHVEARGVIDDIGRQAAVLDQRRDQMRVGNRSGSDGSGGGPGPLHEIEQSTRQGMMAQVVARQVQGFLQDRQRERRPVHRSDHRLRQCQRRRWIERRHPDRLERSAQSRPLEEQALDGTGTRFPHQADAAGLDLGQHQIEHAHRAEAMLAGVVQFMQPRHVPDHPASAFQCREQLAHALLQLAHVDLAGLHVRGRRLEHRPAPGREPACEQLDESGLADTGVANDQERRRRRCRHGGHGLFERVLHRFVFDDGTLVARRRQHATDGLQIIDVETRAPPFAVLLPQQFAGRPGQPVQHRDQRLHVGRGHFGQRLRQIGLLAGIEVDRDEIVEHAGQQRIARPPFRRAQQHGPDDRLGRMRAQRAQHEIQRPDREHSRVRHELRNRGLPVVALRQRRSRHARELAGRTDAIVHQDLDRHLRRREQPDALHENRIRFEVPGVCRSLEVGFEQRRARGGRNGKCGRHRRRGRRGCESLGLDARGGAIVRRARRPARAPPYQCRDDARQRSQYQPDSRIHRRSKMGTAGINAGMLAPYPASARIVALFDRAQTGATNMSIKTIGVVGAGTMGNGIAQACAVAGYSVTMTDVAQAALDRGVANVDGSLERLVKKEKMTAADKAAALGRIATSTTLDPLAGVDLIIEAATENLTLKLDIFGKLDALARPTRSSPPTRRRSRSPGSRPRPGGRRRSSACTSSTPCR